MDLQFAAICNRSMIVVAMLQLRVRSAIPKESKSSVMRNLAIAVVALICTSMSALGQTQILLAQATPSQAIPNNAPNSPPNIIPNGAPSVTSNTTATCLAGCTTQFFSCNGPCFSTSTGSTILPSQTTLGITNSPNQCPQNCSTQMQICQRNCSFQ